jgi:DNA-binding response OmpR family regulator
MTSLVQEVLGGEGARVQAVNDGDAALQVLASTDFDLLILDLGMPDTSGLDILRFLQHSHPDLLRRTLVLTGRAYDRKSAAVLERLHVPRLLKPFNIGTLVSEAHRVAANMSRSY